MKLELAQKFKSFEPFSLDNLPDFVILTGVNGSGKTQLLTAIEQNILKVLEGENSELYPRKHVTSQTLSPNESWNVTKEDLISQVRDLWQEFQQSRGETFFSSSRLAKTVKKIAWRAKKNLNKLTLDDFCYFYLGGDPPSVFQQNFSNLFKHYQDRLDDNRYNQYRNEHFGENKATLTSEQFEATFGKAPWDFVNNILETAGLDYRANSPINNHRDTPFEFKLINKYNHAEIKFGDLSSGEKVIMSLALALYNSRLDVEFPKLLLMDEPDASLHPTMSKKFLDVIQEVFVKEKKVKVIITTHSPSTVALAPEESIFVVNKIGTNRIEKVSKDKVLKILTAGVPSFSVNYENRRQVFVESKHDVGYYELLYKSLSNHLESEISLSFISSGESRASKNGNCGQVKHITEILRKAGNKSIYGIIDWDKSNRSYDGVKVLGEGKRYSIENYILDPLLVGALLLREKYVKNQDLGLQTTEFFGDLKRFNEERLQYIVDYVIDKIKQKHKDKGDTFSNDTLESVKLLNGIEIKIPQWYLRHQGHDLECIILESFPKLKGIKRNEEDALKNEIIKKVVDDIPELLSHDVLDILKSIQEA